VHLIDEEGQPTLQARDEIHAFFSKRLKQSLPTKLQVGHPDPRVAWVRIVTALSLSAAMDGILSCGVPVVYRQCR
jgi:hypothetical protein